MYRSDKQNIKVDALTRRVDSAFKSFEDERVRYQRTTILTPDRMEIADLEEDDGEPIYRLVLEANRTNEDCILLREAISKGEAQHEEVRLKNCLVRNGILYRNNLLWVPSDEHLQMKLIREVHDQPSIDHPGILRTMKIIRRYYY